MTEPERKLWRAIKTRVPLAGTHFRRQAPVDRYIVDFCSFGAKLIVEVDGNQHGEDVAFAYDATRTARLEKLGYRVLRFSNHDVMTDLESVLDTIYVTVAATPTPSPSPQGGGECPPDTFVQTPLVVGIGTADAATPLPLAGRGRGGGSRNTRQGKDA